MYNVIKASLNPLYKKMYSIPSFVVGYPYEKGMIIFPSLFITNITSVVEFTPVLFPIVKILPNTQLLSCLLLNHKSQIP